MPSGPTDVVVRLTSAESVLVVLRPDLPADPRLPERVQERLFRTYSQITSGVTAFARWDRSRTHVIAGLAPTCDKTGPTVTLWGLPVGAHGEATDAEITAVACDTARARDLLGVWVVLVESADGLRLVSSSDLVHTLVRASGPDGTAWATRGLAALRAAGSPPRLAHDRVPELLVFDYVLGDDELLENTTVLPEASVVDSDRRGHRSSTYWSVSERFAPGPPTGATQLRAALGADAVRLAGVPGAHVALTAGRDSTLVMSCLREQGLTLPTFTMGYPGFPDAVGAQAVAAACGTSHRLLTADSSAGAQWRRAVPKSAWTEGQDLAWNLVGPGMQWDGPEPIVWLAGSGGEIGRAFYWSSWTEGCSPVDELTRASLPRHWAAGRAALRDRVAQAYDATAETGRSGVDRLDVLYARGRMRKWLMRSMPRPEARGMLAAYTSPAVVRSLLDIPREDRRTGAVFDQALALDPQNLHVLAQAAVPAQPTLPGRQALQPARLLPRPLRHALRSLRPHTVPGPLGSVLMQLGDSEAIVQTMGSSWWKETVRAAATDPWQGHVMWNALAVEALSVWLHANEIEP